MRILLTCTILLRRWSRKPKTFPQETNNIAMAKKSKKKRRDIQGGKVHECRTERWIQYTREFEVVQNVQKSSQHNNSVYESVEGDFFSFFSIRFFFSTFNTLCIYRKDEHSSSKWSNRQLWRKTSEVLGVEKVSCFSISTKKSNFSRS